MENNKKSIKEVSAGELSINDQTELKTDNETSKKSMIELLEDETFVEILIRCNTDKEMKYLFAAKGCDINDEQLRKIKQSFAEIAKKLQSLSPEEIKELNNKLQTLSDDELKDLSAGSGNEEVAQAYAGLFSGIGSIIIGTAGFIGGLIKGGIDASHEMKDAETTSQKAKVVGRVFLKAFSGLGIGVTSGASLGALGGLLCCR